MRSLAHQFSFIAVDTADVLDFFIAHLLDHGGGLSGAGPALTVDINWSFNIAYMIDDKVNAVQRDINAAFDVAGLVFGAGSHVNEECAGSLFELCDAGVNVFLVKECVENTHGNPVLSAMNLPSVYHELPAEALMPYNRLNICVLAPKENL